MSAPHNFWQFPGGLRLPGHKSESMTQSIATMPLATTLIFPLQQHLGAAAVPVVKVGDHVKKFQMIARAEGFISAPIHASSSGTVIAIEPRVLPHPSGLPSNSIVIATDGKDDAIDCVGMNSSWSQHTPIELRNKVRDAGIIGLGGAGFPTAVKLSPDPQFQIETLILNGAECEPYITCDAMLMQEQARAILDGLLIMRHILQAKQCLIGIEDNKSHAITALQQALSPEEKSFIQVIAVPTRYPAGGEKQLIYTLTGKEVPSQKIPANIGIVCHNVATALAVNDAVSHGHPLIERVVTVTGPATPSPRNYRVRLGTPIQDLLAFAGVETQGTARLIMGGPMMGFPITDQSAPVIKTTNCLLTYKKADLPRATAAMPCIRCGECVNVCPAQLLPQQLYWHARAKDFDKIQDFHLFDCIECACCNYVCPSHIPLTSYYRFAKTEIWAKERDKKKSDIARERHEFHLARIERKKQEDEERKRKKKELLSKVTTDNTDKKDAIAAAMQRVQAKKAAQSTTPQNVDNLTEAQQRQIDEIESRRKQQTVIDKEAGT